MTLIVHDQPRKVKRCVVEECRMTEDEPSVEESDAMRNGKSLEPWQEVLGRDIRLLGNGRN